MKKNLVRLAGATGTALAVYAFNVEPASAAELGRYVVNGRFGRY